MARGPNSKAIPNTADIDVLRDGLPPPEFLRSKAIPLLTGVKWAVEQYIRLRNPDDRLQYKHTVEDIMMKKVAKMLESEDNATQLLAMRAWNDLREMDRVDARGLVQIYGDSLQAMTTKHVADVQADIIRADKDETIQSIPAQFAEAFRKYEQSRLLGEHPTDLPRQDGIVDP